jgi:hypothetical protein
MQYVNVILEPKINLTKSLREMKVSTTEALPFSLDKYNNIRATISRLENSESLKFQYKKTDDNILVWRTA